VSDLSVWWGDRVVGTLRRGEGGALWFRYAGSATSRDRISLSLPVDASQERLGTFFSNLLPDGDLRDRLARRLGVSPDDDFAMLAAVGGDCAGALALLPEGQKVPSSGSRKALSPSLLKRACDLGSPSLLADDGLRLSLAGVQEKLPVIEARGKLYLPLGAAASTHILKLPSHHFRGLAQNELATRLLASLIGLPTAPAILWPLPGSLGDALLVTRFDRSAGGARIHQEDFCQALGLPPTKKYEADGGPALADVIRLLSAESTSPAADVEKVIRWQAFNALVGNCDAHAKNLALLHEAGRVRLAPFYDLVCTRPWGSLSKRLAFSAGGTFDPGALGANQWARAARDWEIAPAFVLNLVRQTAAALKGALAQLPVLGAEAGLSKPAVETVAAIVRKGIRRSEQLLREGR
jgi:serine/threonine-protein kinase HipA